MKSVERELMRLFVMRFTKNGVERVTIGSEITTNATRTTLASQHRLLRKGWIDYEDAPHFRQVFGVTAWHTKLKPAGRVVLEGLLRAEGLVEGERGWVKPGVLP